MTFKLPEPTELNPASNSVMGYTENQLKQALKDVLEQAALNIEHQWYGNDDGVRKAVAEIRKMIGEIK